jgi:hypothetical protein
VEHALTPLQPRPVPAHGWTQARAEDLVWARQYFMPWVLKQLRPHQADALAAKRPQAGPVFGQGRPDRFVPGHPANGTMLGPDVAPEGPDGRETDRVA